MVAAFLKSLQYFPSVSPVAIRPKKTRHDVGEPYVMVSDPGYESSVNPWFNALTRGVRELATCYRIDTRIVGVSMYVCKYLSRDDHGPGWRVEIVSMDPATFETLETAAKRVGRELYVVSRETVEGVRHGTQRYPIFNN